MQEIGNMEHLLVKLEEAATVIVLNRPKALNALNKEVLSELDSVITALKRERPDVPLVITGEGSKAFVAGADISEMSEMSREEAREFARYGHDVFSKIEQFPSPTIAAINGYALGGGNELALACDIRIAAENAKFGQPEVGLGIIPGFGGTQRLSQVIGAPNALDLVLTGRSIDAAEALRIGLVHRVVATGKALEEAISYAEGLRRNSSFAMSQAKKAVYRYESEEKRTGMDVEAELFSQCFEHPDQKEGMKAFMEKRAPAFERKS
jgi:enoyl-CoA hydratase